MARRRLPAALAIVAGLIWAAPSQAVGPGWTDDTPPPELAAAVALVEAEDWPGAIAELRRLAQGAEARNADVWNLLGFAYRKSGALDRAGPAYDRALALDPDHLGALEYQGELFLMQGDGAAAQANLGRLKTLCPTGCEELAELTEAMQEAGVPTE